MSARVSSDEIEEIVGVRRHETMHYGRGVSRTQTFYILHSQYCLDHEDDLTQCRYSLALDQGIAETVWGRDVQDRPMPLGVTKDQLVPLRGIV